jgi:hypothetical protein
LLSFSDHLSDKDSLPTAKAEKRLPEIVDHRTIETGQ